MGHIHTILMEKMPKGVWISSRELSNMTGIKVCKITTQLKKDLKYGIVKIRSHTPQDNKGRGYYQFYRL